MAERCEFELLVKPVGIACGEDPTPKALQFGMLDYVLHQQFANSATAIFFDDENIADVCECGLVADDAGKGDLPLAVVNAEAHRIIDSGSRLLRRPLAGPIGLFDEKTMYQLDVEL